MKLLLLTLLAKSWIMTPNPGLDEWGGLNDDTLYYARYIVSTHYFHKTAGLEGYAGMLTHPVDVSNSYVPFLQAFVEETPDGYVDSLVIWVKGDSDNENQYLFIWVSSVKWFAFYGSFYVDIQHDDWRRYSFPIVFEKSGQFNVRLATTTEPTAHEDTVVIDSLYIKRLVYDAHLHCRKRKEPFYTAADAYYIYDYWDAGYPQSTHYLGLMGMRINDTYASFLDTMNVTTGLWVADWSLWDSTFKLLYSAGMNHLMILFRLYDDHLGPKGMRFDTIPNMTKGIPKRADGSMYLSKACQHTDSLLTAWGWKSAVKYIGVMGEQLTQSGYKITAAAIDTFLSRFEEWKDTVQKYFPDAKVGISTIIYPSYEDSALTVGKSFPATYSWYMPHPYSWQYWYGSAEKYEAALSCVSRIDGADRLPADTFDFVIYSEWLTHTDQSSENNPMHWLTFPGLVAKNPVEWLSWDTWVVPSWMIRFQYADTLTALWWAQYFIKDYQGKKTWYSDLRYSPLLFVKVEPETYIISNPTYDTLTVYLPRSGIAKVRWLDPNVSLPTLRTENRSPLFEKTMAVSNKFIIPPGYVYAIEYFERR